MRLVMWDCDRCGCACTLATEGPQTPVSCPLGLVPEWEVRR